MTDMDGMGRAYTKEMLKAAGEMQIDNLLGQEGLVISGIAGGSAAVSRLSDPSKNERLKKR